MPIPGSQNGPKIITLTGDLASGKSTISTALAHQWGVDRYSGGDLMRAIAFKHDKSLVEINNDPLLSAWLDQEVDGYQAHLGQSPRDLIVDSRLAWHFIPGSMKIKLVIHPAVSARRAFEGSARHAEVYKTVGDARVELKKRQGSERARFMKKYGADLDRAENFDLIIDTSAAGSTHALHVIEKCVAAHFSGQSYPKFWVSPAQLIPTENTMQKLGTDYCDSIRASIRQNGFHDSAPVDVIRYQDHLYLHDGHRRIFGALTANVGLIPAEIYGSDDIVPAGQCPARDMVIDGYRPSYFYDWQDAVNECRSKGNLPTILWDVTIPGAPQTAFMRPHPDYLHI